MLIQKKLPCIFWNYRSAFNSDSLRISLCEANHLKHNPNYDSICKLRNGISIRRQMGYFLVLLFICRDLHSILQQLEKSTIFLKTIIHPRHWISSRILLLFSVLYALLLVYALLNAWRTAAEYLDAKYCSRTYTHVLLVNRTFSHLRIFCATGDSSSLATRMASTRMSW
jgi:hypothetical protein